MANKIKGIYEAALMSETDITDQQLNRDRELTIISDSIDIATPSPEHDTLPDNYYLAYTYTNPAGVRYRRNLLTLEYFQNNNLFIRYLQDGDTNGVIRSTSPIGGGALTNYVEGEWNFILGNDVWAQTYWSMVYGIGNSARMETDIPQNSRKSVTILGGENCVSDRLGNSTIIGGFNNMAGMYSVDAVVRKFVTSANINAEAATAIAGYEYAVDADITSVANKGSVIAWGYKQAANSYGWESQLDLTTTPNAQIFNQEDQKYYIFNGTDWIVLPLTTNNTFTTNESFVSMVGGFRNSISGFAQGGFIGGGNLNKIKSGYTSAIIGGSFSTIGNDYNMFDANVHFRNAYSSIITSQNVYVTNSGYSSIISSHSSYIDNNKYGNLAYSNNLIITSQDASITYQSFGTIIGSLMATITNDDQVTNIFNTIIGSQYVDIKYAPYSMILSSHNAFIDNSIIGATSDIGIGTWSSIITSHIVKIGGNFSNMFASEGSFIGVSDRVANRLDLSQVFNAILNSQGSMISFPSSYSTILGSAQSAIYHLEEYDTDANTTSSSTIIGSTASVLQGGVSNALIIASSGSMAGNNHYIPDASEITYITGYKYAFLSNGISGDRYNISSDYSKIVSSHISHIENSKRAIIDNSEFAKIEDYSDYSSIKNSTVVPFISLKSQHCHISNTENCTITKWALRSEIVNSYGVNIVGVPSLAYCVNSFETTQASALAFINKTGAGIIYFGITGFGWSDAPSSSGNQVAKYTRIATPAPGPDQYRGFSVNGTWEYLTVAINDWIIVEEIPTFNWNADGIAYSTGLGFPYQLQSTSPNSWYKQVDNTQPYIAGKLYNHVLNSYRVDITSTSRANIIGIEESDILDCLNISAIGSYITNFHNVKHGVAIGSAYANIGILTGILSQYIGIYSSKSITMTSAGTTLSGSMFSDTATIIGHATGSMFSNDAFVAGSFVGSLFSETTNISGGYSGSIFSNDVTITGGRNGSLFSASVNIAGDYSGSLFSRDTNISGTSFNATIGCTDVSFSGLLNSVWLGVNGGNQGFGATDTFLNNAAVVENLVLQTYRAGQSPSTSNWLGGKIFIRNGSFITPGSPPSDSSGYGTAGQVLTSGGPSDSVYWGPGGGGGGPLVWTALPDPTKLANPTGSVLLTATFFSTLITIPVGGGGGWDVEYAVSNGMVYLRGWIGLSISTEGYDALPLYGNGLFSGRGFQYTKDCYITKTASAPIVCPTLPTAMTPTKTRLFNITDSCFGTQQILAILDNGNMVLVHPQISLSINNIVNNATYSTVIVPSPTSATTTAFNNTTIPSSTPLINAYSLNGYNTQLSGSIYILNLDGVSYSL